MSRKNGAFILTLLAAAVLTAGTAAGEVTLWAVGENLRIDPETGKALEDNPKQLPGCHSGDLRKGNWIWSSADNTVKLVGGRNEVLAFQVIVEGKAEKVSVAASGLTGPAGNIPAKQLKLFRLWYIWIPSAKPVRSCMAPLGAHWYADAAIPLSEAKYGNGFSIPSQDFHTPDGSKKPAQKNQAVWVDVHVPKDAAVGEYTGKITVTADGSAKSINVRLTVAKYAIPSKITMFAELMNYGGVVREASKTMMYNYFKLAHEHRAVVSDNKVRPRYDGSDYDWRSFDATFGRLFDGSAFTEGPTAGQPIPYWTFPISYNIRRVDKRGKRTKADWPVKAPKTPTGYGVVWAAGEEGLGARLGKAMKAWEAHFVAKGWTRTRHGIFQNCLDEPGFHKAGAGLAAGKEQARDIHHTAKLVKKNELKLIFYKLDIGGGNSRNKLDLDGNGKVEGPVDVANYLGPVVEMFSIHGMCIDVSALRPHMAKHGLRGIFYNGYFPRVGPNTINGELIGFRTWAVSAWRSGLAGWADWQFRLSDGKKTFYETNKGKGKLWYFYRGEDIGLKDRLFASLRLKAIRRGAQDYEMLAMLAARDGNDARAQAIAAMVCGAGFTKVDVNIRNFKDDVAGVDRPYAGVDPKVHWSHNVEKWEEFRRNLGKALSK